MLKILRKWFRLWLFIRWSFKIEMREQSIGGDFYMHDVPRFVLKVYVLTTHEEHSSFPDIALSVKNKAIQELRRRKLKQNA